MRRDPSPQETGSIWLHRYILLIAGCTLVLLAAGALVTGNNAGLSVPDWPLSFGQWMPPMIGGVFFEHGHRMIAATVGFMTLLLTAWIFIGERRKNVRMLGFLALATVVMQGMLGGATVLLKLPPAISIAHACLAQTFFCIMIALAWITSPAWNTPKFKELSDPVPALFHPVSLTLVAAIFVQLLLGAALRHSILGPGREYFTLGISLHIVGAFVVLGLVIGMFILIKTQGPKQPAFARLGRGLLVHGVMQLFLGGGSYMARMVDKTLISPDVPAPSLPVVAVTTLHLVVGAMILAGALSLALLGHRSAAQEQISTNLPLSQRA
jgi:heme a synthase